MTDSGVQALLYLLDQSFDGDDAHSLLGNLRNVGKDAWSWLPPGGGRSIRQIADHAGVAPQLYANHLFGDASVSYVDVQKTSPSTRDASSIPKVVAWMRSGHARFREGLARLGDADLLAPRRAHWGEMRETRWLVAIVIQHNTYHAGEINHVRALRQDDDRWPWETRG